MTLHPDPIASSTPTAAPPIFGRVLCGVDGSPSALEAVRQAALLAGPGAHLDLVCVREALGEGRHAQASISDWRADAALAEARDVAKELGAVCSRSIVSSSDPTARLMEELGGNDHVAPADLIALGQHLHHRLGGILLGSTAATLIHRTETPVLMARGSRREEWAPRVLLVASDGSESATDAVEMAAHIAERHGSQPVLVCVGQDRQSRGLRRRLAQQAELLAEASGTEVAVLRPSGEAHKELPRLAEELRASLIVVGSRGTTGLHALGSVSERVAHSAPCSVLVARHPKS